MVGLHNLHILVHQLQDGVLVLGFAGVVNHITEVAKGVNDFFLGNFVEVLQHLSPVAEGVLLDDLGGLVLEDLNKLSGELHALGSESTNLGELVLDLLHIFLINVLFTLGCLQDHIVCILQLLN